MMKKSFTAQELFCMAYLKKKKYMFGIPNVLANFPKEERATQIQTVINSLTDEDIAIMDFDGKIAINPCYEEVLSFLCDCDKCFAVDIQKEHKLLESLLFWRFQDDYMMAEKVENQYFLSKTSPDVITGLLGEMWNCNTFSKMQDEVTIPQLALSKAMRHCSQANPEDAFRVLRQNGADEKVAGVLIDGLEEKADYLRILLIDNTKEDCQRTERAFLASRGAAFELGRAVVNMRTCTTLAPVDGETTKSILLMYRDCFFK